jgi:hypothetical protein
MGRVKGGWRACGTGGGAMGRGGTGRWERTGGGAEGAEAWDGGGGGGSAGDGGGATKVPGPPRSLPRSASIETWEAGVVVEGSC